MLTSCHSAEGEVRVEYVLALAAGRLAIIHDKTLEDLKRRESLEAHAFGPGFVDHAVATNAISWERAI